MNLKKKKFQKKFFPSPNICQAYLVSKNFPLPMGGGVRNKKIAQNDAKHILVLEFLRSDDFVGGGGHEKVIRHTTNQPNRPTDTMVSR